MRMILLIIFIIVSIYSILGMIDIYHTTPDKEAFAEYKNKTLEEKIKVPEGLEKEYKMILAGKSPINLGDLPENITEEEMKKALSSNEKIDFNDNSSIPMPDDIEPKKSVSVEKIKVSKINKIQHEYLKTNVKSFAIKNENLIANILVFNNTEGDIAGFSKIQCTAYDAYNRPVDQFKWTGNLEIKAKKAILLKNTNMGYASLVNTNDIWCFVDSFKHDYSKEYKTNKRSF